MTYDYSKLSGKIVEKFGTQYNFSKALGLSERTVSLKLNNHISWKSDEIVKIIGMLDLRTNDIPEYFFKRKVHNHELSPLNN